jgi:hypothetical protein
MSEIAEADMVFCYPSKLTECCICKAYGITCATECDDDEGCKYCKCEFYGFEYTTYCYIHNGHRYVICNDCSHNKTTREHYDEESEEYMYIPSSKLKLSSKIYEYKHDDPLYCILLMYTLESIDIHKQLLINRLLFYGLLPEILEIITKKYILLLVHEKI